MSSAASASRGSSFFSLGIACSAVVLSTLICRERSAQRERELALKGRRVVIIGAGVSGLAAAAKLRQHGFIVTVLEAGSEVGGLTKTTRQDGFEFSDGALFIAGASVFDHVFAQLGVSRASVLPTRKVLCAQRVFLPDGTVVTVGPGTTVRILRRTPGSSANAAARELDVAASTRASGELSALVRRWLPLTRALEGALVQPLTPITVLLAGAWRHVGLIATAGSLADEVGRAFSDAGVAAALGASLLYQGSPPQAQPATALAAVVMMCADGLDVPVGGMAAVGRALRALCCETAVVGKATPPVAILTDCVVPPGGIAVGSGGNVTGVWYTDRAGRRAFAAADAVIASVSGMAVFGTGTGGAGVGLLAPELVPRSMRAHTDRALGKLSHSMLSVQLGLTERPAGLCGATVHYCVPLLPEQQALFSAAPLEPPFPFVSFIATTEAAPELAPPGGCILECFAFLRPTPPGVEEAALWTRERTQAVADGVVDAVQRTLDSPLQIATRRVRSPADLAAQLRIFDGRIYGLDSDRSDTSIHYPRRVPGLRGLYLTGQTTHMPGVNIAAASGLLTASEILDDAGVPGGSVSR